MLPLPKSLLSTSTPFTTSHYDVDDSDSGYHSYLSGHCTSVDSSLPPGQCKSFLNQTPDTVDSLFKNVSETKSDHKILTKKEYVDFLHYLGEKSNYTLIVKKILEYLSDEDLYSAGAVSKTWKKVILSVPAQRKRYRYYTRKIELTKENRPANNEYNNCENRNVSNSRSTLTEIQNKPFLNSGSPRSSVSPSTKSLYYRFEAYQMEGQRLKMGKRLFSCPKCKLPSHVDEKELQTAMCTNSSCQYRFCILCHCEAHPSRMCNFISTPMVRKQVSLVGTRSSKNNLKRLLL